jgi:hypothetical protein
MFEALADWELVAMMGESTRYESMAIAERLAMVAQLYERRKGPLAECEWWIADHCSAVAAEVSAVQKISHARAVAQVQLACDLWHRLPRVAKVFLRGTIDYRVVSTIVSRTENVDDEVMAEVDEAIASHAEKWMTLSKNKLRDRVDQWVAKFDPAGVRVPASVAEGRYFTVEADSTTAGMAFVRARLHVTDAAAIDQRVEALAASVCANDPRTHDQRRADAGGAWARGQALTCACGSDDCPAQGVRDNAAAVVVHILAEQSTLQATSNNPGYLEGFGMLPAESVRQAAATARLEPLVIPGPNTDPDPGYRPRAQTTQFLRFRDLTCCWPGCDRPVAGCDVDHSVPWPQGPTHPSNTKHYCRIHHLIKTFHPGWRDQQMADGTIVLTTPTGHTYCTHAHGAELFPALARSTGELSCQSQPNPANPERTAKMPRRTRTREQAKRARINAERRQRTDIINEQERQHQAWLAATYEPPPF